LKAKKCSETVQDKISEEKYHLECVLALVEEAAILCIKEEFLNGETDSV